MARPRWANIPTAVLDEEKRADAAAAWAQPHREALARQWGDLARAELDAVVKAYGSSLQPAYPGQLVDDPTAPNHGFVYAGELPEAPEPSVEPRISIHNPFTGEDEAHTPFEAPPINPGLPGFGRGLPLLPATKPPPEEQTHRELIEGDADLGEIGQRDTFNTVVSQGSHLPAAAAGTGLPGVVDDAEPAIRQLVREGPGVATKAAQAVESATSVVGEALQPVAQKVRRFFHGTGSAFDTPDPKTFDPTGMYGPAYYLTDDARVAGSYATTRSMDANDIAPLRTMLRQAEDHLAFVQRDPYASTYGKPEDHAKVLAAAERDAAHIRQAIAEAEDRIDAGPNIRAIDVPDLNLFDADAPAKPEDVQAIRDAMLRLGQSGDDPNYYLRKFVSQLPAANPTNQHVYEGLAEAFSWLEGDKKLRNREFANVALSTLGYDGVRYGGGKRIPITDDSGKPIEHEALAIFPSSLPKIKNAISGTPMGAFAGVTTEENEQGETEVGFDPVRAAAGTLATSKRGQQVLESAGQRVRRFFHGTNKAFDRPDSTTFDPNGLFGPGYYVTTDADVAASYASTRGATAARHGFATDAGPNMRAIDVPDDVRLLDADGGVPKRELQRIAKRLFSAYEDVREAANRPYSRLASLRDALTKTSPKDFPFDNYTQMMNALKEFGPPYINVALAGAVRDIGYGGIEYLGGRRTPLMNAAGDPIEHKVAVIFATTLPKIRNAISGAPGGIVDGVTSALGGLKAPDPARVGGALGGAATSEQVAPENETPEQRASRLIGSAFGGAATVRGVQRAVKGQNPLSFDTGITRESGAIVDRFGNPLGRTDSNQPATDLVTPGGAPARVVSEVVRAASQPAKDLVQTGVAATRAMTPEHRSVVKEIRAEGSQKWIDRAQAVRYSSMLADWVARINDSATGLFHTVERPLEDVLAGYPKAGAARVGGIVSAIPEAAAAFLTTLKTGDPKFGNRREGTDAVRPLGNSVPARVVSSVTDFMAAADDFVKSLNYNGSLMANAQKRAAKNGTDIETELLQAPPDLLSRAEHDAQIATYTEELGGIPKWMAEGRQLPGWNGLFVSLAIPFFKVGANIARRGAARTARGIVIPGVIEAAVKAANGDGEAARYALAKTAIASGLATVFLAEALSGNLKGSLPEKKGERDLVQSEGERKNSWNVMGSGRYVDLAQLGDVGAQAIVIANAVEGFKKKRQPGPWRGAAEEFSTADWGAMAPEIIEGIAEGVSDISWLQGIARLFSRAPGQGPLEALTDEAAGIAASGIPLSGTLNRVGKLTDTVQRETKDSDPLKKIANSIQARIPKNPLTPNREDLPAKQDVLGRDVPNDERGMWVGLRGGLAREDAVIDEILNVGASIGDAPKDVKHPNLDVRVPLNPGEQRRYRTVAGERIQEAVKRLSASETYKRQGAASKKKLVEDAIEKARAAAGLEMLKEMGSPEISRRLRAAKPAA